MFTAEAIQEIQASVGITQATEALTKLTGVSGVVALPSDFKTIDFESHSNLRRRPRGNMSTDNFDDFASYVSEHKELGTCVFVNKKQMSSIAFLNLGNAKFPGHADNIAIVSAQKTVAYQTLLKKVEQGLSQQAAAEFLEDWTDHIKCFVESTEIKVSQAVASIRKLTIDASRRVEYEVQSLSAQKSSLESIQASSVEKLPTIIYFTCDPYLKFESRVFMLRLSVGTGGDKPTIHLRIIKQEQHDEELAVELAERTVAALKGIEIPVRLGVYEKK